MKRRAIRTLLMTCALTATATPPVVRADTGALRFLGRPTFKEGKAFGYFIWRDGESWKVRWTTFGANHHFFGRVTVEGGEFRDFKRIDVDEERRVIAPGRPAHVVRGPRGRVRGVAPGRAATVVEREEDHINQETEHLIRFAARTDDDIDGFDFKTAGGAREIRFYLGIDGRAQPGDVEVGKENFKPQEDPIIVKLP